MDEHVLKTISDLEKKAEPHEQALREIRSTINKLYSMYGEQPKYKLDEAQLDAGSVNDSTGALLTIKADQFYNKPQATAVREALTMLRAVGRAPASVETIYDVLAEGGFNFDSKARDAGIQGLHISIGKNSALFVKLSNGLVGVKEWYGPAPRARGRGATKAESNGTVGTDDDQQQPESGGDVQQQEGETS